MSDIDYDPRQMPYLHHAPDGLVYVWHGGAYIDICTVDPDGDLFPTDRCLNVWDYETDRASVDYDPRAFIATVYDDRGERHPRYVFPSPVTVSDRAYWLLTC